MEKIDLSNDAKAIAAAAAVKEALSLLEKKLVEGMVSAMPHDVVESFNFYMGSHDPMFFASALKEEDHQEILRLRAKIMAEFEKQFELFD